MVKRILGGAALIICGLIAFQAEAGFAEQAARGRDGTFDAYRGSNNIRTDPAYALTYGYAHPNQLIWNNGDFVAVGTYKSAGVPNTGCSDDYDNLWNIYTDGSTNGQYFCQLENSDAIAAGNIPPFQIEYGTCAAGGNGWRLSMQGLTYNCYSNAHGNAYTAASGLETTNGLTTDKNLDVRFLDMQVRVSGSWVDFGTGYNIVLDPNYTVTSNSSTRFDTYLAPLD
ncbi:hypothetical protein FB382_002466 [Nocardioides ginsengisegetis]|uniref:Uncharacterized protein n=1 Tax=Nocardioides ginsengisegetis TaxID=661491 RepID=A0A7W3J0Q3_9ACTN|nr:hypothetical protein [Nocardioides ginsengisegetis]MBA8804175.1 hypothetical protein [Nocardioides ginsengisegetis]